MQYLKADTNTEVLIGPVVAVGDGFTPVTTLSLSTADEAEIIKYGGATPLTITSISANGFAAITSADGYYTLDISTSNSDTEGFLTVLINDDSLCLPIRVDFMVVNANVYDSLFAAATTDYLQTDVAQWLGTAAATPTTAGVPEVDVTFVSGTAQTANDNGADINTLITNTADIQSRLPAALVGGLMSSDVTAISTDTTAADNLELQYDTTGLTGDTFPATQAEVGAIGSASGGGLNFEVENDNVLGALKSVAFVGVQTGGTYASTEANDNVYHNITHSGNAIDIVYQVNVGGGRTIREFPFKGYLSSANDTITVQMYDFVGTAWETRGFITGQGGTTNLSTTFSALSKHTGTSGADLGLGFIRFVCTVQTAPDFFVDELLATAASEGQSTGYALGAVWIDTISGVAGTESFVNGVADNPVSTIADALTIATAVNLRKFEIGNGSTITLAATTSNKVFEGHEWALALGGQNVANSMFIDATVSGTGTGSDAEYMDCSIGAVTHDPSQYYNCVFTGTFTVGAAGDFLLKDCSSGVAGATSPVIDMGAAIGASTLELRSWSGGITINNLAAGDVVTLEGIFGAVVLNGADAQVEIRGIAKSVTNNLTGSPTVNDNTLKSTVIDELTTQGDTNETKLDTIDGIVDTLNLGVITGAAQTGTLSTTQATSDLTGYADDQLIGRVIVWTSGACDGEATDITDYASASGLLTFTALTTAPANTDTFKIV